MFLYIYIYSLIHFLYIRILCSIVSNILCTRITTKSGYCSGSLILELTWALSNTESWSSLLNSGHGDSLASYHRDSLVGYHRSRLVGYYWNGGVCTYDNTLLSNNLLGLSQIWLLYNLREQLLSICYKWWNYVSKRKYGLDYSKVYNIWSLY